MKRDLETYLRRATRGLWGRKRLELREELTQHLFEKTRRFELAGLSHEAALRQSLETLGSPESLNRAMIGVLMPRWIRSSAAALLLTLTATLLFQARAQPDALAIPMTGAQGAFKYIYALSLPSLRASLEPQGVRVGLEGDRAVFVFPGGRSARVGVDRPQGNGVYVGLETLVWAMRQQGLPVSLRGWETLDIEVAGARLRLPRQSTDARVYTLYGSLFLRDNVYQQPSLISSALTQGWSVSRWNRDTVLPGWLRHRVQVQGKPGTVYAVLSRDSRERYAPGCLDFAVLGSDGYLEFHAPFKHLEFSGGVAALSDPASLSARAVLVRFTGRMDAQASRYALALPVTLESDAVK